MSDDVRSCWLNCYAPGDRSFLEDRELLTIDAMADSVAPLDEQTSAMRRLITRFELCYHQADKEAELIAEAIGSGRCSQESTDRPPQRRKELQNCFRMLSRWCENTAVQGMELDLDGVLADELLGFIGEPSPLKAWQVGRVVDKVGEALDPERPYHRMALNLGDYGEPGEHPAGEYYKDNLDFLRQTKEMIIHDTVDGREGRISLAMAIDLLMPCHWDFVGSVVTILKAIGGDLHPARPYACCARNVRLSPLCGRMRTISDTLGAFWKSDDTAEVLDRDILASLGEVTAVKRWLAASLDKTIRLHLTMLFEMDLT
ncbi:MAG: hypothetical protein ABIF19_18140 [Planctomycetota bacterium]